jgi:hypothetical protein
MAGTADRTVVDRLFTHPRGTDGTAGRCFDQLVSGVVWGEGRPVVRSRGKRGERGTVGGTV